MKKLSSMKIASEAVLNEMEASAKGERKVGNGTDYHGPSNPSTIHTYVDGIPWGEDGSSGTIFGDTYDIHRLEKPQGPASGYGKMLLKKQ